VVQSQKKLDVNQESINLFLLYLLMKMRLPINLLFYRALTKTNPATSIANTNITCSALARVNEYKLIEKYIF